MHAMRLYVEYYAVMERVAITCMIICRLTDEGNRQSITVKSQTKALRKAYT